MQTICHYVTPYKHGASFKYNEIYNIGNFVFCVSLSGTRTDTELLALDAQGVVDFSFFPAQLDPPLVFRILNITFLKFEYHIFVI